MSIISDGAKLHNKKKGCCCAFLFDVVKLALPALLFAALGAYVVSPDQARAAIGAGNIFSYQGRLTDTSGNSVADGAHCFRFSIYDAQSAGTKLWPSATPSAMAATTTSGVFNIGIGDVGAGGDDLSLFSSGNDNAKYLNVEAGNQVSGSCAGTSFETLAPRQRLESVPTAYELYGGDARIGTGTGAASGQKLLKLDVKSVADTVGATACSPNGALWYNSGNARTLVCNNNLYQVVGSSITNQFFDVTGPTTTGGIKTFAFPDASATVLTTNAAVTAAQGGTGQASYTTGDILYASGATALSKLADVAAGSYLRSGGAGTAPVWSTMTLPNTGAQGDILYSSGANVISTLAKDTNATRYLSNTGASNNPAWAQVNLANGVTGTIGTANLGSGTANSSTYLRGDQTWAAVSGGANALLDGASHTDTAAGTVARGDIITGQTATPKWTRLAKGTANQVLSMDASGVDVVWATPTGGGTPGGANTQIQYNNAGAFGGDADFTWNTANNDLFIGGVDPTIILGGITSEPAAPSAGNLTIYSKAVSGRMMLKMKGPSGLDTPLQPAIFQNSLWLVQPNTTTSVSPIGGAVTSVGTLSTPAPSTTSFGLATNFASAATANSTAGTGQAVTLLNLSGTVAANGGFFVAQRLFWPDANYGSGATGARFFVGVTDQTMAVSVGADNPAGNRIGFALSTNLAETNFMLTTKNGTTETRVSTGVAFVVNNLYDFYLFVPPGGTTIYWRIDNLSTGSTTQGSTSSTLPAATIYMRAGFQIATLTTTARNIRMKKIYVETDN